MRMAAILFCLVTLLVPVAVGEEKKAQRSVTDLVKALKEGDDEARIEAAREIAERGITASRASGVLRKLMLTESGEVLLAVADALEKTGAKMAKTVKELTPQLGGPEPAVRARAAWALALIPTADSAAPDIAPLVEDTEEWVRVSAACALLRFGHEPDRMALILVDAIQHEVARVRLRAIRGLRYLPGVSEPVVEALASIAAQGGPEGIQACTTLAALGPRAVSALPTLRQLLESADGVLAIAAAKAFGSLGPEAAKHVPDLLDKMMIIGPELVAAHAALVAMGEAAVPALAQVLEKGDIIRQTRAAMVLERLGPTAAPAVPALIRLVPKPRPRSRLYDDVSYMQAAAIRTLGNKGKAAKPALPALEALARTEPREKFREEARDAIFKIRAAKR